MYWEFGGGPPGGVASAGVVMDVAPGVKEAAAGLKVKDLAFAFSLEGFFGGLSSGGVGSFSVGSFSVGFLGEGGSAGVSETSGVVRVGKLLGFGGLSTAFSITLGSFAIVGSVGGGVGTTGSVLASFLVGLGLTAYLGLVMAAAATAA